MPTDKHQSVFAYLQDLTRSSFYGTVSIRYDAGRIVLLNIQQALKPETIQQLTSQEEIKPRSLDAARFTES